MDSRFTGHKCAKIYNYVLNLCRAISNTFQSYSITLLENLKIYHFFLIYTLAISKICVRCVYIEICRVDDSIVDVRLHFRQGVTDAYVLEFVISARIELATTVIIM